MKAPFLFLQSWTFGHIISIPLLILIVNTHNNMNMYKNLNVKEPAQIAFPTVNVIQNFRFFFYNNLKINSRFIKSYNSKQQIKGTFFP